MLFIPNKGVTKHETDLEKTCSGNGKAHKRLWKMWC